MIESLNLLLSLTIGLSVGFNILGLIFLYNMWKKIKKLDKKNTSNKKLINALFNSILRNDELVNRRIDGEIDRTNKMYTETNIYINDRINEVLKKFSEPTNNVKQVKKDLLID
jgi:hypothetical protein